MKQIILIFALMILSSLAGPHSYAVCQSGVAVSCGYAAGVTPITTLCYSNAQHICALTHLVSPTL